MSFNFVHSSPARCQHPFLKMLVINSVAVALYFLVSVCRWSRSQAKIIPIRRLCNKCDRPYSKASLSSVWLYVNRLWEHFVNILACLSLPPYTLVFLFCFLCCIFLTCAVCFAPRCEPVPNAVARQSKGADQTHTHTAAPDGTALVSVQAFYFKKIIKNYRKQMKRSFFLFSFIFLSLPFSCALSLPPPFLSSLSSSARFNRSFS